MKKKIIDGHMTVTAKAGHFVGTQDRKVFGKTLSLGKDTSADTILEEPEGNWPSNEEEPEQE